MEGRVDKSSEMADTAGDKGEGLQPDKLFDRFNRGLAQAVAIAGAAIIPAGIIISVVFGGWRGLAGAFVGFGVASLYTIAAIATVKWALKKPIQTMPTVLLATVMGRLVAVVLVLFGLTYATAINLVAVYSCFLALFLAYTILEITFAWRTFGVLFKPRAK
jgi:hypothetical protein